MERWREALEIAAPQLGLITRDQLRTRAISDNSILNAVRSGRLSRIHNGVYAFGPLTDDPRLALLAAVLAAGAGAALSHRSAGGHLRLIPWWPGPVAVTVPADGGRSRPGIRVHRRRLQAIEVVTFDAIRCTSPSRTILDLCAMSADLGERAMINAGARGMLDIGALQRILEINHGCRGAGRLRVLLEGRDPVPAFTRSRFERLVFRLCERAGLPLPDMNVEVWAGGAIYECDCVWPAERLIVECDSRWHDNPITARKDAQRDEALTLAGWRVHRIRWAQLVRSPERLAATIGRLLVDQRRLQAATRR
ncbi:MAG: type IV toxin-antitoxin system AbiEi family antitoxin domain-containing protein [Solirubrobacterales bacterium]